MFEVKRSYLKGLLKKRTNPVSYYFVYDIIFGPI